MRREEVETVWRWIDQIISGWAEQAAGGVLPRRLMGAGRRQHDADRNGHACRVNDHVGTVSGAGLREFATRQEAALIWRSASSRRCCRN